jgi:hypothetical protein
MVTLTPDQAKRPITRAAGPYGHPFHPMLVDEATQAEGFNRS